MGRDRDRSAGSTSAERVSESSGFALDMSADVEPPGLDAGPFAQPPTTIEPETFYLFLVVFGPYSDGGATSSFVIQTDGDNPACPSSPEFPGDVLTIQLTGAGGIPSPIENALRL
jgi:hypothetical protein